MEGTDVERESRDAAISQVAALFQRPDQLERIAEIKKRSERKKAAVEAMLRTGVQSTLEGIRSAIAQLKTASEDIVAIETETEVIRTRLAPFPKLQEQMTALRECSVRHDQYAAAIENLRLIVNLNELVSESRKALNDSHLLVVHKNIMDLERARDELMYEVHKLNSATMERDKKSLLMFFKDVDELVDGLWGDMKMVFKRCLEMVRGNEKGEGPQQVVSALRIVEREERIDRYYIERRITTNDFMPPGRPRRWKAATMAAIEHNVQQRVEGNQIEHDRSVNPAWLARYLETCRNVVVNDLILAKSASATCFPPEYGMYDRFVGMYHHGIRRKLFDVIKENGLIKAEIVQLLVWIKEYTGELMLGNARLRLNAVAIVNDEPLLPPEVLTELQERFLSMTRVDLANWLKRTLAQEQDDWKKNVSPEIDAEGKFYTTLPSILFGMIEDTMRLAKEFSTEILPYIIDMAMQEFVPFVSGYKDAAVEYKNEHFKDRSKFGPHFTPTMIAVANNMMACADSTEKYLRQIRLSMEEESGGQSSARGAMRRADVIDDVSRVVDAYHTGSSSVTGILYEEVILDINKSLAEILTKKWLDGTGEDPISVILLTLHDYHNDHSHLRSNILLYLAQRFQMKIVGEYIKAIESRRTTFASLAERTKAGSKLRRDADQIERAFRQYVPMEEQSQFTPLHAILSAIADVLELTDRSLISLEAVSFARKFPNCPVDVLAALLMARDDVGRAEARQMAEDLMSQTANHPKDAAFGELFMASRADGSMWNAPMVDVHAATSKLATILRR